MPLTRSFANLTAITTVKIGTAACRIAVRLESILVSAHAKSMNGVAVLISPTSRIATHALRACFRPALPVAISATGTSTTQPSRTRNQTSAAGSN